MQSLQARIRGAGADCGAVAKVRDIIGIVPTNCYDEFSGGAKAGSDGTTARAVKRDYFTNDRAKIFHLANKLCVVCQINSKTHLWQFVIFNKTLGQKPCFLPMRCVLH